MTTRALNRAFLARQLLLERSSLTPVRAIEHLVGLQAQAPNPPYIGLWTRLARFEAADLSRLISARRVVRIALMRSTIHLVTARDCLRLRPLLQPVSVRAVLGGYRRHLEGLDLDAVVREARVALDEGPRTFAELGAHLSARWPGRHPQGLSMIVRAMLPLVQVPPRGLWGMSGAAAHAPVDAWLGPQSAAVAPLSADALVLRYLAAFGPATIRDVQAWSGLTKLADVIDGLRARLRTFTDERGRELFDLPRAPRPGADIPAPPRFLPEFDNAILSHADRTRIVPDSRRKGIFTVNGMIPGTLLVDGFVAATWTIRRTPRKAVLDVATFGNLPSREREPVVDEGLRLLAFTSPGQAHDVRFRRRPA